MKTSYQKHLKSAKTMNKSQQKSVAPGETVPSLELTEEERGVCGWVNKHTCVMEIGFHNLKPHDLSNTTSTYSVREEMDGCQHATEFRSHKSSREKPQ